MLPIIALFYGDPPFGTPHVNPTIETWGAGDYTKVRNSVNVSWKQDSALVLKAVKVCLYWFCFSSKVAPCQNVSHILILTLQPYEISPATIKSSGYVGVDNEIGSPSYFIDYTDTNGPDNDHHWLQSHPFY